MDDLGQPISYIVLELGTAVLASDGEKLGRVKEIRGDEQEAIFDSLVVEKGILPGGDRLVLAEQIEEIHERGVVLKLAADSFESLPEPG